MITAEHVQTMARYNRWMNARVYDACAELSDEERKRDLGAFFRSIHVTLNHLLLTDMAWLGRFTRDRDTFTPRTADNAPFNVEGYDSVLHEDFADLRKDRERMDTAILNWAQALTAEQLSADIGYRTWAGQKHVHPLWYAVLHLGNHQTHHRGQVTTMLSQLGKDVGATDLLVMLRNEHRGS